MKVDGQESVWFNFVGNQKFEQASVSRKSEFDWSDPFHTKNHLAIDAGGGDDLIKVSKTGDDEYTVSVNGQEFQLSRAELQDLELDGGAGNDTIIIDESVDVAINVKGGSGDDRIINHASGISIDGGDGNDEIVSNADACDIRGGRGNDRISVTGDGNRINGAGSQSFWDFFNFLGLGQGQDQLEVSGQGNKIGD